MVRAKFVAVRVASARGVAERWAQTYQHPQDGWRNAAFAARKRTSKEIRDLLCELGDNPPLDKVAEIIGNKSWSYISCDGCPEYVERAVAIGEYEPKVYCETCITEAAQAFKGES